SEEDRPGRLGFSPHFRQTPVACYQDVKSSFLLGSHSAKRVCVLLFSPSPFSFCVGEGREKKGVGSKPREPWELWEPERKRISFFFILSLPQPQPDPLTPSRLL